MAQYAGAVPAPEIAVLGSGLLLLVAGATIVLGLSPKVGIACAALFLVGVTPMMHNFWAVPPEQQMGEKVNFTKNFALLGSTLMLVAIPEPWPASEVARDYGVTLPCIHERRVGPPGFEPGTSRL
jgi:putative oxidoreductase